MIAYHERSELEKAIAQSEDDIERRVLESILEKVDFYKYQEIQERHSRSRWRKFFGVSKWVTSKYAKARELQLVNSESKQILDIGCGPSYFALVCQPLGHQVVGIDVDNEPLYYEINELFRTDWLPQPVRPQQHLPDFGRKFDLITAMSANFPRKPNKKLFDLNDWEFFFDNLLEILNKNGHINLHLNKMTDAVGLHYWDDDFVRLVESYGGSVEIQKRTVKIVKH